LRNTKFFANSSKKILKVKGKNIHLGSLGRFFSYLFCAYLDKDDLITESFSILQKMCQLTILNFSTYFKKKVKIVIDTLIRKGPLKQMDGIALNGPGLW
jgi:predicted nucleotide-binding protein (sugar kinase/HSP70/actin superfamily)